MGRGRSKFFDRIKSALRREDGAVTVDFVLWMPIIFLLLAIIADTSLIFGSKSQVLRVIQDANRAASVGKFTTTAQTITYIHDQIVGYAPSATITSVVSSGVITSTVSIPASDLTATGFFSGMANFTVTITAQHMLEA